MKAFIYTGGDIYLDGIREHPTRTTLSSRPTAAIRRQRRLGHRVNLLVGDMDSLGETAAAEAEASGCEVLRVKPEKDDTDTQLAVHEAVKRGADEIVIIGGLSGRLDHTLSNLAILESLCEHRIPARIMDGLGRARFLKNDSLLLANEGFRYLSLIAVDEVCRGVTAEGVKYPLANARLVRTNQYAISNEITGVAALISVKKGRMYVIESSDR